MTVPALPKFSDVKAEFGGLISTPLSAYIRGGAYVPIQTIAPIPTALPLNLLSFANARSPATLSYVTANMTQGFAIGSAVVASDLSTATFVVTRTRVANGGSSSTGSVPAASSFAATFAITGATSPSIVIRTPATQPRDANGYWKLVSAYDLKEINTPAQLGPVVVYATYENQWAAIDSNTAYQGQLRINTLVPTGNGASPPSFSPTVTANQFDLNVTVIWQMDIGTATPPGSQMTWNTRNGTNTFVEFPIVIDVYDGALLRSSYPMLLHFEINSLLTFNPS